MSEPSQVGLRIPISGVQLIEASAGTGKTFTLATLYARMVIETALPVSAVLAVTFTETATKELRERLRARLLLAQRLLESAIATGMDGLLDQALDGDELAQTRELVRTAAAREGELALCRRLRLATEQMDLAPILTIHGFCRRALADHALEAGQALLERELLANEAALRREVALEFWRAQSRDATNAVVLSALWKSPEALAQGLRELVAIDVLLPCPEDVDPARVAALDAGLAVARSRLRDSFGNHGLQARALLRDACAGGQVNATVARDSTVDPVWRALEDWMSGPGDRDPMSAKLSNYSSSALHKSTNKKNKAGSAGVTPTSPLFEAIEAWRLARAARDESSRAQEIAMVHAARAFACARMAAIKQERGLLSFDDMIRGVADALEGPQGEAFAARLRDQYAVALLDEFQDTDERQWSIFRRLFAQPDGRDDSARPRALVLVGDPKQAIYRFRGGDVFTYLAAQREAQARHRLDSNFRSRPLALQAVQALFELSGEDAFAQPGIAFESVQPGDRCRDDDFQRIGAAAPALNFVILPPGADKEGIDEVREHAIGACVAGIHGLLAEGLRGAVQLRDRLGALRSVQPGDIAVLVEKNADAERMQRALAETGIPSVAAGRSSLYQTDEAQHLHWLFHALLAPADDARLRAALASPLFGLDAAAIAAFDEDEACHRLWQDRLQHWQQRAERYGPMALVGELCAQQAPRLLALRDGERRVSNYLQLAEELQAADSRVLGLAGLLSTLERSIEDADSANDTELLRLESDSARVKILTMHMSKGLEFEFVFLPMAATGGNARHPVQPPMARFHDGTRRIAVLYPDKGGEPCQREAAEERAEKIRLLYVALTRARLATWVVWGAAGSAQKTAMAWLLHRSPGAAEAGKVSHAGILERLAALQACAPQAIHIEPAQSGSGLPRLQFEEDPSVPEPARATRMLDRDWWVYSFSQLAREDGGIDSKGAEDETEPLPNLAPSRFSGTRFGNALHAALEEVAMDKWLDWSTPLPPPGEFPVLVEALRQHGYASEADLDEGVPLLTALIAETLNARLPEGTRLAALPEQSRRNEMEFHLALAPTRIPALLELLHRHGIVEGRAAFGLRQRIEGLLTGRIDLVYEAGGRFHVVDYKSNQLRDYSAPALHAAVRDSEYDLQYVLYTLALHRWLRFRLGASYDSRQHLGGVRYLFARGLDRHDPAAPGVHAHDLPEALLEELDLLFQGGPA